MNCTSLAAHTGEQLAVNSEQYKLAATNDDDFATALAQMVKDVWEKQGMPYTLNEDVARLY
jgi:hypothetical protein